MSDLASLAKLARSTAQLPVGVYFDDALLHKEKKQLFQQGPQYAGHELMVPNVGDYAALSWENEGRILVRNPQGIESITLKSMNATTTGKPSSRCISRIITSRLSIQAWVIL